MDLSMPNVDEETLGAFSTLAFQLTEAIGRAYNDALDTRGIDEPRVPRDPPSDEDSEMEDEQDA
jgi:hypothetical protein